MIESVSNLARRMAEPLSGDALREHMIATYRMMRLGLGLLALLMPFVLVGLGWWFGIRWQDTISDYYFALPMERPVGQADFSFPVRSFFCGGLAAIAFCLFLYKGFTRLEDWLLNLAALFALGVAFIPMNRAGYNEVSGIDLHYASAVALFVAMALVCWFCAKDTLPLLADPAMRERYRRIYDWHALGMLVFPLLGLAMNYLLWGAMQRYIFFIEAAGIWVFASFWLFKGRELRLSDGDERLLRRNGERPG